MNNEQQRELKVLMVAVAGHSKLEPRKMVMLKLDISNSSHDSIPVQCAPFSTDLALLNTTRRLEFLKKYFGVVCPLLWSLAFMLQRIP